MHWLDNIILLFEAETNDLRELANITGLDPEYFYIGTDISGADIRGQDLRGMRFTNLNLDQVKHDEKTKLDILEELQFVDKISELQVKTRITVINRMKRQEERLIATIKLYFESTKYAHLIDEMYIEKAKFARNIIDNFRANHSLDLFGNKVGKHRFYNFIDHIINISFPNNRGRIILYLARYFGGDPAICSLIKKRLVVNQTMSPYFVEVSHILQKWEKEASGKPAVQIVDL